jgi:serine/threonine-protein kinase
MADAETFERALNALLAGESLDGAVEHRAPDDPSLDAIRVLSAISQSSLAALFGGAAPPRDTDRWGHLEIRGEIGRGTSGTVYRAWDTRLAREVALKLFDPDSASADAALAEGRLLARLRHPNIVSVYGADTFDGVAGLWMELVEGDSLDDIVDRDGRMGVEDALLIGIDLARALSAVHAAGMLHRDVKARNVVRQRGGRLVLMDFGAGYGATQAPEAADGVGTPLYMAPEVLAGGSASVQNDIYGLGVLLYHLITTSYPVTAPDLAALVGAHRTGARRSLREDAPLVPTAVRDVIDRACASNPGDRFGSAQEFEASLTDALGTVISARVHVVPAAVRRWRRWRRLVMSAAASVTGIVMAAWLGWNTGPGRAARRAAGLTVMPRSPLYLTFDGGIGVVEADGMRLLPGGTAGAHAIAVSTRWGIRTMASQPPWAGGAWLGPDGTPQRAAMSTQDLCCFYDGTTDGRFNYTLRQDSTLLDPIGSRTLAPPAIHRYDLEWRHGEVLFELGASVADVTSAMYYGIAFDARSQALWVTRHFPDGTAYAERWGLDGGKQATLPLAPYSYGIAVDPSDGTLWVLRDAADGDQVQFDNYTPSGALLGSHAVARPVDANRTMATFALGLEFAWPEQP